MEEEVQVVGRAVGVAQLQVRIVISTLVVSSEARTPCPAFISVEERNIQHSCAVS